MQLNSLPLRNVGGAQYLQQVLDLILSPVLAPSYATVGAIIAARRPGNGIGWLCLALGITFSIQDVTWQYATHTLEIAPGSLPAGQLVAWLSKALLLGSPVPPPLEPPPLLFTLLLLIFPDGHFLSRRWRFVGWIAVGWTGLITLVLLVSPTLSIGLHTQTPNPTGIPGIKAVVDVVKIIILWLGAPVVLAAGTSIFVRWHRASGQERQQLKWLTYMLIVTLVTGLFALASSYLPVSPYIPVLFGVVALAGVAIGIPVSIGIAILRHRLYNIDILINRTLVYGTLTGTLALVYFGLIIGLQSLVRLLTGTISEQPLVIVASTLTIAALFQPLRKRIQRIIDRRFYRSKYDAARTLEAFSATLRQEVDLDQLREELLAVVQETMQPSHVSLWLRSPAPARKHQTAWSSPPPAP